jgi:hypothetical protein
VFTPIVFGTPVPRPTLDHFLCYEIHRPSINMSGVSTSDQFFPSSTVRVRQAKRLCAPVNKNGEDPMAPSHPGHETFYTIRQAPPFERKHDIPVAVVNDFGSQPPTFPRFTVDLVRAERMLVPTSKSLVGPNFPPPLAVPLDHFKCYRVRGARFRKPNVAVETQFGALSVSIKRPRSLCVPVDKNGEGIFNDALSLMCFQVRTTPQTPRTVFTTNQFEQGAYDIFGVRDLCVPAIVNPGICGDGTVNAPGELCDGNDGLCPGHCDAGSCTCDPFCGDSVVDPQSEECDPPGSACQGTAVCAVDCTCAPVFPCLDEGEPCQTAGGPVSCCPELECCSQRGSTGDGVCCFP